MGSPDDAPRRPVRAALLASFERFLAGQLDRLEWREAQRLGRAIGSLAWRAAGRDRRRTLEHLAIAFSELDPAARARLGRDSFRHLGACLTECLWLAGRAAEEADSRIELLGWENVAAARAERRPLLVVSGHCGNWELVHAALNRRGLGMAVIARGLEESGLQRSLVGLRAHFGTETIVRGSPAAARALRRVLRSAGALGLMLDQDTQVDGVFVDFFGRPAWTPVAAAELAHRLRASTFTALGERLPGGTHRVTVNACHLPSTDPVLTTQSLTSAIEAQIRRVPEQWVWMHRRWRRQPASGLTRSSAVPRMARAPS